jgi:hypothetical protein
MGRNRRWGGRGDDPGQLQIEWGKVPPERAVTTPPPLPVSQPPLVQYLPWDFQSTFPQPTPEAIDAGVISDEDAAPENLRALHEEHAREALAVLRDLDRVLDARRRGVDPRNNKPPMLKEAKERLKIFFDTEPGRLDRWWQTLMDTYEQAFGPGSQTETSRALLLRADLAIVPCKASMLEVRALAKATEVLRVCQDIRAGLPKAIIVLSMVGKNYLLTKDMKKAAAALKLPLASRPMILRQIYADAPGQGRVVWNMGSRGREAAEEVDHIFREILPDAAKRRVTRAAAAAK